jgi:hypothetical protein
VCQAKLRWRHGSSKIAENRVDLGDGPLGSLDILSQGNRKLNNNTNVYISSVSAPQRHSHLIVVQLLQYIFRSSKT